jgi:hypothetical protein
MLRLLDFILAGAAGFIGWLPIKLFIVWPRL